MKSFVMALLLATGCAYSDDVTSTKTQAIVPIPDEVCEALTGEQNIEGICENGDSLRCGYSGGYGFCCLRGTTFCCEWIDDWMWCSES